MRVTPPFLDGALLSLSAMPDVCAVIDSPRCEMERAFRHDAVHDRGAGLTGDGPYARNRRIFAIDWREGRQVTGTEDRLRETIIRVAERRPGEPIVVLRGFMSLFVHTDLGGVAASLRDRIDSPLVLVEQISPDDDWVDGWQSTQRAIETHLIREGGTAGSLVTGYCVHRTEGDELGNIEEIRGLWRLLGMPAPVWPACGESLAATEAVAPTAVRFVFPYAGAGEPGVRLELPLGFEATASCLRVLAAHGGRPEAAEPIIDSARALLLPSLQPAAMRTLAGRGAVVAGDPWRVRALARALSELGVDVPLAVVLRRGDAVVEGREELEARGTEIVLFPDGQEIQERLIEGAERGMFHVVVGSGLFRDAAELAGLGYVEAAMPYCLDHFSAPTPIMGFGGLPRLADRLDLAISVSEHRARRRQSRVD